MYKIILVTLNTFSKKLIKLVYFAIFFTSISYTIIQCQYNAKDLIDCLTKEIAQGNLNLDREEYYSKQFRLLMNRGESANVNIMTVMNGFLKIQESIRKQFKFVTDAEYQVAGYSVGKVLFNKNKIDQAVDVLIREAKCFNVAALIFLKIIYQFPVEGVQQYDPKIFQFFQLTAKEGSARSMFDYGQILLYGWGTKKDIKEGLNYLQKAGMARLDEANLQLAAYYFEQKDTANCEKYLKLAAEQGNARAMYNLAIFKQQKGEFKEAFDLLNRVLVLEPDYYSARLELGRLYVEGWGVAKDVKKGFNLINEVAQKAQEKYVKAIAYMNLGIFYENGIGTQKSASKAKQNFKLAEELGFKDAEEHLKSL